MALVRLIYRSQNAIAVAGSRILIHYHDIVSTARMRNTKAKISGFLMFDRERYHQILEGEESSVDELYARIVADQRHRNVELLVREKIDSRGFPDWSMGSFLSDREPHPLQVKHGIARLAAIDGNRFLAFALEFVKLEPNPA
ncbi:MAG: BLUF domain-containing protein [Beijerinckiaceae bacterium]